MRLKKVLGVFIFLILTLGILVSADVFSINSGGGLGIFLSPGANIEGFFSASTIDVSSCGALSDTGAVYTLTQNVSSTGTCFTVAAQNVTLNCQGHSINYSTTTVGYGLVNNGYHFVTLENCEFNLGNFGLANSYGVYVYGGALNNTIDNIKVTTTSISTAENKNNYGIYFNNVQKSIIKDSNIYLKWKVIEMDFGIISLGDYVNQSKTDFRLKRTTHDFVADTFSFYKSTLTSQGPTHHILKTYTLH